jgi:hypothetical protein
VVFNVSFDNHGSKIVGNLYIPEHGETDTTLLSGNASDQPALYEIRFWSNQIGMTPLSVEANALHLPGED